MLRFADLTTTSRVLYKGRCKVHSILVAGDGANGDSQVFDGENSDGDEKFHIEALSGTTALWLSSEGVNFMKGIYIAVNAATTHVTVEYEITVD